MVRLVRIATLTTLLGLAGQPAAGWAHYPHGPDYKPSPRPVAAEHVELALYPLSLQPPGTHAMHAGYGAALIYHLSDRASVQLRFLHAGYLSRETDRRTEIFHKTWMRDTPSARTTLNPTLGFLQVELTPFFGAHRSVYGKKMAFSTFVSGGFGFVRQTIELHRQIDGRDWIEAPHQLQVGIRPALALGLGARIQVGRYWGLRMELQQLFHRASIESVVGCTGEDLAQVGGMMGDLNVAEMELSGGCRWQAFDQNHLGADMWLAGRRIDGSRATITRTSGTFGLYFLLL